MILLYKKDFKISPIFQAIITIIMYHKIIAKIITSKKINTAPVQIIITIITTKTMTIIITMIIHNSNKMITIMDITMIILNKTMAVQELVMMIILIIDKVLPGLITKHQVEIIMIMEARLKNQIHKQLLMGLQADLTLITSEKS